MLLDAAWPFVKRSRWTYFGSQPYQTIRRGIEDAREQEDQDSRQVQHQIPGPLAHSTIRTIRVNSQNAVSISKQG